MIQMQALHYVIIPQAVRLVIPSVTNDCAALLKDSSLVSAITIAELTKAYSQLAIIHYDYLGIGLLAAAMCFLVGLPFVPLARLAERYFTSGNKGLLIACDLKFKPEIEDSHFFSPTNA
jgi:polar amino acid transport system substrate-binding protein